MVLGSGWALYLLTGSIDVIAKGLDLFHWACCDLGGCCLVFVLIDLLFVGFV